MKRSELKQLIRETIEEISADTARRAADKAKELGRYQQAGRLQLTAQKKDVAAFGGDVKIEKIKIGETGILSSAEMLKLGKTKDGKPGISIRVKEPNPVAHYYKESEAPVEDLTTAPQEAKAEAATPTVEATRPVITAPLIQTRVRTPIDSMAKYLKTIFVRNLEIQLYNEEISYGRMLELIQEEVIKNYKQDIKTK